MVAIFNKIWIECFDNWDEAETFLNVQDAMVTAGQLPIWGSK